MLRIFLGLTLIFGSLVLPDINTVRQFSILKAKTTTTDSRYSSIYLVVSLVWTGQKISKSDLQQYDKLREDFPSLKVFHFISGKYFIDQNKNNNLDIFRKVIKKHDNAGLYLAPWASLVTASGINDRSSQEHSFWGSRPAYHQKDWGMDTFMDAYTVAELDQFFEENRSIATETDLIDPEVAMVAGWNGSQKVRASLIRAGFKVDFSPINPISLQHSLSNYPGFEKVKRDWSNISYTSRPKNIRSHIGQMIQIPQNFGTIDYISPKRTQEKLNIYLSKIKNNQSAHIVQLSLFSKTLNRNYPKLKKVIQMAIEASKKYQFKLVSTAYPHKRIRLSH